LSVSSSDLPTLSLTAGFDVTNLFFLGSLDIDPNTATSSGFNPFTAGANIASAVRTNNVPTQNGIALIEQIAGAAYDNLSPAAFITTLVSYAQSRLSFDSNAGSLAGNAIASLIPGSLDAATAVADTAVAALLVATASGSASTFTKGQQLGVMLGQLASALGSDAVVAAVNAINGATTAQTVTGGQIGFLLGLGLADPASVSSALQGLIGSALSSVPGAISPCPTPRPPAAISPTRSSRPMAGWRAPRRTMPGRAPR
jgi:hypothetical protein